MSPPCSSVNLLPQHALVSSEPWVMMEWLPTVCACYCIKGGHKEIQFYYHISNMSKLYTYSLSVIL